MNNLENNMLLNKNNNSSQNTEQIFTKNSDIKVDKNKKNDNNSNSKNEDEKLIFTGKNLLNSLKIVVKVLGVCIISFSLFIGTMFFVAPKLDAKIFNFFNLKRAEEACYIQIYKKSGSLSDLYNLVVFEMNEKNYEKELNFILELISNPNFDSFCKGLDVLGENYAKDKKSMLVYVADTKTFLCEQEIKCLYYLHKNSYNLDWTNDINLKVFNNLNSNNLTETSFCYYLSLIYNSNEFTNKFKSNIITLLYDYKTSENLSIDELLNLKEEKIQNELLNESISENKKILLQYSLSKLYLGRYYFESMKEEKDAVKIEYLKNHYEESKKLYNELIV